MRMTNRVVSLLLMLALAVPVAVAPATSFAQSAGDDQYVDPFQDDNSGGGNNGNNGNSGNSGSDTPAQQPTAQAPADSSGTAGTTASETAAKNGTLPRTGVPEGMLVGIGVILLLGGGLVLRRAWPRPE